MQEVVGDCAIVNNDKCGAEYFQRADGACKLKKKGDQGDSVKSVPKLTICCLMFSPVRPLVAFWKVKYVTNKWEWPGTRRKRKR